MAAEFHRHRLGVVVDVVPNHMARPTPETFNRQLWSVLYQGRQSQFAHWFDVDWEAQEDKLLLPILAGPLEGCLGDLIIDTAPRNPENAAAHRGPVLRYFDHVLPLRDGVADLPLGVLLAQQHYRLTDWHDAATQLNYRRFFDIESLIALRVEDPDVFYEPWSGIQRYDRVQRPMREEICAEGNRHLFDYVGMPVAEKPDF